MNINRFGSITGWFSARSGSGFAAFIAVLLVTISLLAACEAVTDVSGPGIDEGGPGIDEPVPGIDEPGPTISGSVLSGRVVNTFSGGPLACASVTLKKDGATIAGVTTGVDGLYSFNNIASGEGYIIEAAITAPFYITSATAPLSVLENIPDINFALQRNLPASEIPGVLAAGTGQLGSYEDNLMYPFGIGFGPDGTLYIADADAGKIRKMALGSTKIIDVAGTGGSGDDDGEADTASFAYPWGLAVASNGEIYVADEANHRIRKISNGVVSTIAGTTAGFGGDLGLAINAQLQNPKGVAIDGAGNVYIADFGNHRIRKIDTVGIITTIAGTGVTSSTGDNASAVQSTLNHPIDVAVDTAGNLYIVEHWGHRVRKIDAGTNIITTVAGNGPGLSYPAGIAVGASETLYIADSNNQRVVMVRDGTQSVLAGISEGNGLDQLRAPERAAIGPDGYLYVTDSGNARIMKF